MSYASNYHPLAGKAALVTGASRGIGSSIALHLASLGADVAVSYSSNKAAAEQTAEKIKKTGVKTIIVQGDLSNLNDVKCIVKETVAAFGKIDILVNNAGVYDNIAFTDVTESNFDKILNTNFKGVYFLTQEAVKAMPDGGRIINISSAATKSPFPGISIYVASKSALEGFTRALAIELAPRKITVNTVSPGYTATDMLLNSGEGVTKMGIAASPLKRLGTTDDIANSVTFLATNGDWLTGQNIQASGGSQFAL
jgi:3-oxoacyl-[acyl-carrier protein] reductase